MEYTEREHDEGERAITGRDRERERCIGKIERYRGKRERKKSWER